MSFAHPDHASYPFGAWGPRDLLLQLSELPLRELDERLGTEGVLLVKLHANAAALSASLGSAACLAPGVNLQGGENLEFKTTFADADELPTADADPRGYRSASRVEDAVLRELRSSPVHVVPLRKRSDGAAFLDKITIGRTRNHDIVLREGSVSKFHAAMTQRDGRLHVQDMGSKNHTRLNGVIIAAPTPVSPGDVLSFGSVEAVFCTAAGLWHALQDF